MTEDSAKVRGEMITALLRTKGITKKQFAKEMNISYTWLIKVLNGDENASADTLDKWCDRLGARLTVVMTSVPTIEGKLKGQFKYYNHNEKEEGKLEPRKEE